MQRHATGLHPASQARVPKDPPSSQTAYSCLEHLQHLRVSCSVQAVTAPFQEGRRRTSLTRSSLEENHLKGCSPAQEEAPSQEPDSCVFTPTPVAAGFLDENFAAWICSSSLSSSRKRRRAVKALQCTSNKKLYMWVGILLILRTA